MKYIFEKNFKIKEYNFTTLVELYVTYNTINGDITNMMTTTINDNNINFNYATPFNFRYFTETLSEHKNKCSEFISNYFSISSTEMVNVLTENGFDIIDIE